MWCLPHRGSEILYCSAANSGSTNRLGIRGPEGDGCAPKYPAGARLSSQLLMTPLSVQIINTIILRYKVDTARFVFDVPLKVCCKINYPRPHCGKDVIGAWMIFTGRLWTFTSFTRFVINKYSFLL